MIEKLKVEGPRIFSSDLHICLFLGGYKTRRYSAHVSFSVQHSRAQAAVLGPGNYRVALGDIDDICTSFSCHVCERLTDQICWCVEDLLVVGLG